MTLDPAHPPIRRAPAPPATIAEWLAIAEEERAELINGRIVYHTMPGPRHGATQLGIGSVLAPYKRRTGGPDQPGGWWLSQEVDMHLGDIGCRPDLLGWQRDKHPRLPASDARGLVTEVPEWICEVLSHSTAGVDMGAKRSAYHRAGVSWYWLADPMYRTLTVLRRTEPDYLIVLVANVGERVRAEPFDAVEIDVGAVFDFGDEPAADE